MSRLVKALAFLVVVATAATVRAVVPGTNGRIAFASDRTGSLEIFSMELDGSGLAQLTPSGDMTPTVPPRPVSDREPAWSPDGTRIAFRSDRTGDNDIWLMNADGTGAMNLTNTPSQPEGEMSWSPNGSRIVFRRIVGGVEQLWVMNSDGTGQTALATTGENYRPDWSPAGNRIVFASDRGAGEHIRVINPDGSGDTALTQPGGGQFDPAWSPDASRIAFARESALNAGDAEIIVMNADGTNQQNVTNDPSNDYYPAWSPDGATIAFARTPAGTPGSDDIDGEIFTMATNGSGQTNRTNHAAHDTDPDWQRRPGTTPTPTPTPTGSPRPTPTVSPVPTTASDVALELFANRASVRRGRPIGFTVIVRNGVVSAISTIEVVVTLPPRLSYVGTTGSGCTAPAPGGTEVTCVITRLPAGHSATFVVETRARRSGVAEVRAQAFTLAEDPTPNDNVVVTRVRVKERAGRR